MAKGLRASVNKRNKSKLRDRVFGPVEAARTERLSAKLLELAQQPKPARDTEMLVDGKSSEGVATEEAEKIQDEAEVPEGQCVARPFALACPVPRSLSLYTTSTSNGESSSEGEDSDGERAGCCRGGKQLYGGGDQEEDLFYMLLGLGSDVAGFTNTGDISVLFDH